MDGSPGGPKYRAPTVLISQLMMLMTTMMMMMMMFMMMFMMMMMMMVMMAPWSSAIQLDRLEQKLSRLHSSHF